MSAGIFKREPKVVFSSNEVQQQEVNQVPIESQYNNQQMTGQQALTVEDIVRDATAKAVSNISQEFGDKYKNFYNQKAVIEKQSEYNKELKDKLAESIAAQEAMRKELDELRNQINTNSGYADINNFRQQLEQIEKFQAEQKIRPVIEYLEQTGIPKEQIKPMLEDIQQNYKTDFFANPDMKIVKYVASMYQGQAEPEPSYTIPQGSMKTNYYSNSQQYDPYNDPAVQERINAIKEKAARDSEKRIAAATGQFKK